MTLAVEDNGPGIPEDALETIFTSGYTTRGGGERDSGWPLRHRGLGLAITRSIVEAAGGRIRALNREQSGVRFEIELPLRKGSF
jgi:signal transduction histidine kinase